MRMRNGVQQTEGCCLITSQLSGEKQTKETTAKYFGRKYISHQWHKCLILLENSSGSLSMINKPVNWTVYFFRQKTFFVWDQVWCSNIFDFSGACVCTSPYDHVGRCWEIFSELCSSKKNQKWACLFAAVAVCATLEKGRIWIKVCQVRLTCATLQICGDCCSAVCSFVNLLTFAYRHRPYVPLFVCALPGSWHLSRKLIACLLLTFRRWQESLARAAPHTWAAGLTSHTPVGMDDFWAGALWALKAWLYLIISLIMFPAMFGFSLGISETYMTVLVKTLEVLLLVFFWFREADLRHKCAPLLQWATLKMEKAKADEKLSKKSSSSGE